MVLPLYMLLLFTVTFIIDIIILNILYMRLLIVSPVIFDNTDCIVFCNKSVYTMSCK